MTTLRFNINTKELFKTSELVADLTGIGISPNKPVVGRNVFATEAGIHQAALLKDRRTYEIIKPEEVGQKGTTIVLGRHSGKHALYARLQRLGYRLGRYRKENRLDSIYDKFKELAHGKKEVTDQELLGIAREIMDSKKR